MDSERSAAMTRLNPAVWAVLPAALIVGGLLVGSFSLALVDSFSNMVIGTRGFSFDGYLAVLSAPGFLSSLALTCWVAFLSTLLTIVGALLTAFALRRVRVLRGLVAYCYQLPLTMPHIVVAAAGLMLLSQSGIISRVVTALGLISTPSEYPELVFDRLGIGIIAVYVWKQIPFIGLIALATLQSVGEDYEGVARTLGARRHQVIRHVMVPLVAPGVLPASVIIFAYVFGSFEIPLLLGARYPSMMSVLAYRLYTDVDISVRPQAMALTVIITLFVLALMLIYRALLRRVVR
jgi:putative spermidine/putrescine transport system permease protein